MHACMRARTWAWSVMMEMYTPPYAVYIIVMMPTTMIIG